MSRIAVFSILIGLYGVFMPQSTLHAHQGINMDKLLDAIYISEGGEKASVPYGLIYDSWCVEAGACRYYAGEIVRVHLTRCGQGEDPIECIGRQYAPTSHSPLNHNWVKNVRYYYNSN